MLRMKSPRNSLHLALLKAHTPVRSLLGSGLHPPFQRGLMNLQRILLAAVVLALSFLAAKPAAAAHRVSLQSQQTPPASGDRKSTRLNSSHMSISYAVFC